MKDLLVSVLQSDLYWEDVDVNLASFDEQISALDTVDIIVLPEMFTTGFSMRPEHIADADGRGLEAMQRWAKACGALVIGSIATKEKDKYFNRLYAVFPAGEYHVYDKRHLFSFAGEDQHYSAGAERLIIEWQGWKICCLVCYDLRFPVWSRNRLVNGRADYDLLMYVANWPAVRRKPWDQLLVARAIENQSYVVACNRVGKDGNGALYNGGSAIIDAKGDYLATAKDNKAEVMSAILSVDELQDFRMKFPVLKDADSFSLD